MNFFVIFLLILNLGLMVIFFFITRKRFSENKYLDNIKSEVAKLIGDIQLQSETCIRILEDKIAEANEVVKSAESRIDIIKNELNKKKNEVVVLDKLMSKNSNKVKKANEEKTKKIDTITIYSAPQKGFQNLTTDKVLQLHHDGLSPAAISKQTGMPIGEVKLIISLEH